MVKGEDGDGDEDRDEGEDEEGGDSADRPSEHLSTHTHPPQVEPQASRFRRGLSLRASLMLIGYYFGWPPARLRHSRVRHPGPVLAVSSVSNG